MIGGGAVLLGVLALFAYLLYMLICVYFVYPVIMVENKGPIDGLRRSYELAKGQWCEIFGILILWAIFKAILGYLLLTIAFTGMDFGGEGNFGWTYYLAKVLDVVFGIFFAAVDAV